MPSDNFQKLLPDDAEKLPYQEPNPHFKTIYMLEIDIKRPGGNLSIVLGDDNRNNSQKIDMRSYTLPANASVSDIEDGVADLLAGHGTATHLTKRWRGNHRHEATSMSMNFKEDCYILFKMNKHMDNVRFSSDYFAFMREDLGQEVNPITWGNRVDFDGSSATLVRDAEQSGAGWSAALFAYERSLLPDQDETEESFRCRFNLYLDVVDGNINDEQAPYIPIIVDPDVRFPGGNEGP